MTLHQCCILIQKDLTWYACFWVCLPCNLIIMFSYCLILCHPRATCYVPAHMSDVYHTFHPLPQQLAFCSLKGVDGGSPWCCFLSPLHIRISPLPAHFHFVQSLGCFTSVCPSLLIESVLLLSQCRLLFFPATHTVGPPTECFRVVSNIFIYMYFII